MPELVCMFVIFKKKISRNIYLLQFEFIQIGVW